MPTISKRLDVVRRLTAHLEGMTVAGGYGYDMAGKVYRGRSVFGDEVDAPFLSVLESPRMEDQVARGGEEMLTRVESLMLLVQGFGISDATNPLDGAYDLLAHVERRLAELIALNPDSGRPFSPAWMLNRTVSKIMLVQPVVRSPGADNTQSRHAFFYLPVSIEFPYNPYTPFVDVA